MDKHSKNKGRFIALVPPIVAIVIILACKILGVKDAGPLAVLLPLLCPLIGFLRIVGIEGVLRFSTIFLSLCYYVFMALIIFIMVILLSCGVLGMHCW